MSVGLTIQDLGGEPERWSKYLEEFPDSGAGHHYEWGEIIRKAYGMESKYLVALKGSEVRGLLSLVFVRSRIFGNALVSMPYLNDGGILAKDRETEAFLWSRAIALHDENDMDYLEIRHSRKAELGVTPRTDKISMVLDIGEGEDEVWRKKLHTNVRNKIRKSEKMGVEVKEGPEFLRDFYEMHITNMQELGSPAHSIKFFEEAVEALKDRIRVYAAFVDGKTVGGKVICYFKETLYFLWVSSPREYLKYAAVSLMDWVAIRDAANAGMRYCDFGRSTRESTHFDFKKKWGSEPRQLFWYVYPEKEMKGGSDFSKKYEVFSAVWRKMPRPVVKSLGPWLRKGLPQ